MKKLLVLLLLIAVPAFGATAKWLAADRATGYVLAYNEFTALTTGTEVDLDTLNLVPGATYVFKVAGYNNAGAAPWSNEVSYTVPLFQPVEHPAPITVTAPARITITIE